MVGTIALDHTRILGSTVEAIAQNKAGIFKRNQPALVGPGVPLSVTQVGTIIQDNRCGLLFFITTLFITILCF